MSNKEAAETAGTAGRIGKIGRIRSIGVIGVIGSMRRGYHSPIIPIFPIFPINFTSISALISRQKCQDLPTSRNCTGRGCTQCTSPFRAMSLGAKIGAYHEKYFLLEGIRYNARRISRRWAVLEVLPIDEIIR